MGVLNKGFQEVDPRDYDALIVGCGFAGSVLARELAERKDYRVLIIEKRSHIGGNMYDSLDESGILVHRYGPHIFHTNRKRVFDYILRFTDWRDYEHTVLADVHGTYLPVPFNKNSLEIVFGKEKAAPYIERLIHAFGDEQKVRIAQLRKTEDPQLAEIADYVYKNIFLYYTQKQWGLKPEELDPGVTGRVPVFISRDNRYFQDHYQGMPAKGYHVLFENMLEHPNIDICLSTEAESVLELRFESEEEGASLSGIRIKGQRFEKPIVYTGPLDELFLARFGRLPYRSLDFSYETHEQEYVLPCATVNYTVSEEYTRITEFKYLTGQTGTKTTIMKEYPKSYLNPKTQIPYYAIISDENDAHYKKYRRLVDPLNNFYPLGRLAEYRYYNMDEIIEQALLLADKLC